MRLGWRRPMVDSLKLAKLHKKLRMRIKYERKLSFFIMWLVTGV